MSAIREPVIPASVQILPVESENFFDDLEADWQSQNPNVWREISEKDYWYCLEVLPPLDVDGGHGWHGEPAFMVSEPYTHTATDVGYTGCVQIDGRYFARNVERRKFRGLVSRLTLQIVQSRGKELAT